jgi:glycosyltransferase involved in cell wall biosynthesis
VKILLVTFPNDLGSRTIEANLIKFISKFSDLQVFRFAAHDSNSIDKRLDNRRNLFRRIQDTLKLRKQVKQAVREKRKILFYNISPALFALGSWRNGEAYITLDWARRLLVDHALTDRDPMTRVHRLVLKSCKGILPMTDAMADCLRNDYDMAEERIHRVPSLFDVEYFDPGNISTGPELKLLFIGGDIYRKGGDLLYQAFAGRLHRHCKLTMVTNGDLEPCEGLTLAKGVRYGTPEHLNLMRSHDVFILPTREDAGPQVIGEAASAGLAVFTTRFALGAPHVVIDKMTGAIADTPEDCIKQLENLLQNPDELKKMRQRSLDHMRQNFSPAAIVAAFQGGLSNK